MKVARIVINTQNALFADMLRRSLRSGGDFNIYLVERPEEVVPAFRRTAADIVLMEVTAYPPYRLEERLELCRQIKQSDPNCKVVLLVDEKAEQKIADDVKDAKLFGLIDQFVFSSVSSTYLVALLETL